MLGCLHTQHQGGLSSPSSRRPTPPFSLFRPLPCLFLHLLFFILPFYTYFHLFLSASFTWVFMLLLFLGLLLYEFLLFILPFFSFLYHVATFPFAVFSSFTSFSFVLGNLPCFLFFLVLSSFLSSSSLPLFLYYFPFSPPSPPPPPPPPTIPKVIQANPISSLGK